MNVSRRHMLTALGALALIHPALSARAQNVNVAELMAAGPLPDRVLGSGAEKTQVTVVEYASMTCSHCARFHNVVYPDFKKKYIDTGKVRFILREFPLDPIASGAFALARCMPEDKYYSMIDVLFEQQKNWAFVPDPPKALLGIAKQAGFTEQSFEACLTDQKLAQAIEDSARRANEKFGVNGTPTFFINGQMLRGEATLDALSKVIDPLLKPE
ncbi:MAG TPA: DsbA family protein [Xanthobacteraceae bacterium]|nr:DsbA family protein [Xanthobacteraceae bacterium]